MGEGLAGLVAPIETSAFFADYFEMRPLLVARREPARFADLVTLDDIDRILTTHALRPPVIAAAAAGAPIDPAAFTRADGAVDVARLLALHDDGATLILNSLDDVHPPLAALCDALALDLSARVQANIYVTPPGAVGFPAHADIHDVFILQAHGAKRWRLAPGPIQLPLEAQAPDLEGLTLPENAESMVLGAGDTLYIPRGVVHQAETDEAASIHLTLGAPAYTWGELLHEALATAILEDVDLRRALPPGFARPGFDLGPAEARFGELVARFASKADAADAFEAVREAFVADRPARLAGQFAELAALQSLDVASVVGPRPSLAYGLRDEADAVVILCHGKEIRVPSLGAEAARHALASQRFIVGALPGRLDAASKLALVRRLVREGLLRRLAPD